MRTLITSNDVPAILIFTILALVIVLVLTFYVEKAKKKMGVNLLYMLVGGLFIGLPGIRAAALDNPFYVYMVVLFWNLLAGVLHIILSRKFLEWPKTESFGWRMAFAFSMALVGFAGLLSFMKVVEYEFMTLYNLSAVLTFFIPTLFMYAIDCYLEIPDKMFIAQKPWMYNRSTDLQFKSDEISHFFLIKYRLTAQTGGEALESLSMRAPGNIKLGNYFNSTLEVYKVTQGRYTLEVKDLSNNYLGWFFFLADGSPTGKVLDPNKTFLELGFSNPVYFGNSSPEEIENITMQSEREGKTYTIICKRELEYKSQLMQV